MQEKGGVSLSIKLTNSKIKGVFNFYKIYNKKAYCNMIGIDTGYKKILIYTTKKLMFCSPITTHSRKTVSLRFKVRG